MQKKDNFKLLYAISIAWQLGFIIAIPIGLFLFLGAWADKRFSTQPFFIIAGGAVGILVTVRELRHVLEPFFKKEKETEIK